MEFLSYQKELLEVVCSTDAGSRSDKMLKIFDNTLNTIIDNLDVSSPTTFNVIFVLHYAKIYGELPFHSMQIHGCLKSILVMSSGVS